MLVYIKLYFYITSLYIVQGDGRPEGRAVSNASTGGQSDHGSRLDASRPSALSLDRTWSHRDTRGRRCQTGRVPAALGVSPENPDECRILALAPCQAREGEARCAHPNAGSSTKHPFRGRNPGIRRAWTLDQGRARQPSGGTRATTGEPGGDGARAAPASHERPPRSRVSSIGVRSVPTPRTAPSSASAAPPPEIPPESTGAR